MGTSDNCILLETAIIAYAESCFDGTLLTLVSNWGGTQCVESQTLSHIVSLGDDGRLAVALLLLSEAAEGEREAECEAQRRVVPGGVELRNEASGTLVVLAFHCSSTLRG